MKSYYLPDELFHIVKQFAGIYNMRTTISKMDKDYVEKARYYLNSKHHQRFNVGARLVDGYPISCFDKKKKDMLRYIYSKKWTYEIAKEMEKLCLPNIDKMYSVGDEITIRDMTGYDDTCGIITKINDYSISFKSYQVLPQIHSYNVKQREIPSSLNDRYRRSSTCPPKYTTENTFWKVQYYDKSSFKRAKCITSKQSSYMIKNLLKKENQFEALWNSDTYLSEFVCNKHIDWGQGT
jgi:hypothetical protein